MKKFILLLNNYLSTFWFILLLSTIAGYLVLFVDPMKAVAFSFGANGEFTQMYLMIWRFWVLFLLPLAVISIIIATIIWLKDKTGNSYRGFSALIITILSLGILFLFIPKLLMLDYDIKNNTGIFGMPTVLNQTLIPAEELGNLNIVFRYGVGAKNELDTLNKTYIKDMIMEPAITTNLQLSQSELDGIHKIILNLNILDEKAPNTIENIAVTPCSNYYLKAMNNSTWQELSWDDCHGRISDKLQTLTNYITQIIKSKEEYKKLPAPKGGYL